MLGPSVENSIFLAPKSVTGKPSLDPPLPTVNCTEPRAAPAPLIWGLAPQMVIPGLALSNLSFWPQSLPHGAFSQSTLKWYCRDLYELHSAWCAHSEKATREGKGEMAVPCLTGFVDKKYQLWHAKGKNFCISFCGCKTRCSLNSLAGPLSLTGEGQPHLEGVPCYSGTRQSNSELKEDGPASWLLVDTERAMRGRGTTD